MSVLTVGEHRMSMVKGLLYGLAFAALDFLSHGHAYAAEATIEGTGTMQLGWQAPTQNIDGSDLTDLA